MQNISNDLFKVEVGADGIAVMTIDQKNNPTNLFSNAFINAFIEVGLEAIADDNIKGVIVTSGRSMFMPGADLRELKGMGGDPETQLNGALAMHKKIPFNRNGW